jgi:uncharacterized protein
MLNLRFDWRPLRALALSMALCAGTAGVAGPANADPLVDYFRAVGVDNADGVGEQLAHGVGPNASDPRSGETGLILAMRENAMRVFALLLAAPGVDLEAQAPNGNTALMMAAFKHNKVAVLALLDAGAQVNRAGWTALHYAAAAGDKDIVLILLEHHARIDAYAPGDITPLMIAAREGQEAAVEALLAAGANTTLKSGEGLNAAAIAERADKPAIAAAIRAKAAANAPSAAPQTR